MAYFPGLGVVLVGGTTDGSNAILDSTDGSHAATWVWNGATWAKLAPATEAPAGWGCALAYDSNRNVLVYIPARGPAGILDGIYAEFDGTTWTVYSGAGDYEYAPPGQSMAYDKHRQKMVYYSNNSNFRTYATYELNATSHTWSAIITNVQPPYASQGTSLVYDEIRELIYAVGPDGSGTPTYLFSYDGTAWTQVAAAPPPDIAIDGQVYLATAWDPIIGKFILKTNTHTWTFDGTTWTQLALTSEGFSMSGVTAAAAMAYDIANRKMVLFGGANPSLNNSTFVLYDPVVLLSIAISGGPIVTRVPCPFSAIGTYSDGSTTNITTQVTWTTSNPLFATIDSNGVVTGYGDGPVRIGCSL